MQWPLGFGLFMPPFHHPRQNPTLALRRDLDLIVHAEALGYEEVWVGEHHSTGHEFIAAGDIFIAAAAERTRRIRLGTGVISLPFHHPLIVADRAVLLDHLMMGRFMLGVGPGSLPTDSTMMGLDHLRQREMMAESFDAIMRLLTSDEPVTMKTDWFTLENAQLQLRPYSHPLFETAVAAIESPVGPRLAGQHGAGLLCLAATSGPGFNAMPRLWEILEESASEAGRAAPDRRSWRVCGMMHVAPTRAQAIADVSHGLRQFIDYGSRVSGKVLLSRGGADAPVAAIPPDAPIEPLVEGLNDSYAGCVGDPDDAVRFIRRLIDNSQGGFGKFLLMTHDWADPDATFRSLEIVAREVFPEFQGSARPLIVAQEKAASERAVGAKISVMAVEQAQERYERDKRGR